ncbi:MAG: ribonuclease [Jatrophihabitans endophyticus]|nr:ribonuclease [Jatrophihabitans endophyticus]
MVALLVLVLALVVGYVVDASRTHHPHGVTGTVALSSLPPQAARTVHLIEAGGPFPYPEDDGIVFHNYEHDLPSEPDGYYHEYTVPTPGADDRGARRIVTGRDGRYWWTGDHYESFERIELSP